MFKDIWDAITENSPKDLKEFKVLVKLVPFVSHFYHCLFCCLVDKFGLQEELGLEYDEDVGLSLQSFTDLLQNGKKRTRGQ